VVYGSWEKGGLSVIDGDKRRKYSVWTTAYVGPIRASAPSQTKPDENQPNPSGPAVKLATADEGTEKPADSAAEKSGMCGSETDACVMFLSDPRAADIYIHENFAGSDENSLTRRGTKTPSSQLKRRGSYCYSPSASIEAAISIKTKKVSIAHSNSI
jgi:hypothetical protein